MSESYIKVVQDSPRTNLDIPVKFKNPLSRIILPLTGPPFGFKLHERLIPVLSRDRLFRHLFAWGTGPSAIFTGSPRYCAPYAHRYSSSLSLMWWMTQCASRHLQTGACEEHRSRYVDYSQRRSSLCREQLFFDSMVAKGTCPDRSWIKQLRVHNARHQSYLGFPGSPNVGHEPSQVSSTLDGFGSRDLEVFA